MAEQQELDALNARLAKLVSDSSNPIYYTVELTYSKTGAKARLVQRCRDAEYGSCDCNEVEEIQSAQADTLPEAVARLVVAVAERERKEAADG